MLDRGATWFSSRCYPLRCRPRERQIRVSWLRVTWSIESKQRRRRKPAAPRSSSSSGRGIRNVGSVLEAPSGLSAEPWPRSPTSPPRRLSSGRLRQSQSYCTDTECLQEWTRSTSPSCGLTL
ncbi:small integral membrane protein 14 isoform X1 [Tamandua tetradactyla]|uniref:small integral membrane protein 14 isoform X1 n=1 Tax=Tamandua tetradactyla TaxID=48850 RepID=UPI004054957F